MIVIEIAERMECGEPSPLFFSFPGTKSGEGSPHSKGSADLCAHFIFSLLFVNIRVYSWLSGHNHKIR
jgi:hypothetical protein